MPLERRLHRLKILKEEEESEEEDGEDAESSNKLIPLFEDESKQSDDQVDNSNLAVAENNVPSQQLPDPETTLESFRHEWKVELTSKNKLVKPKESPQSGSLPSQKHTKTLSEVVKYEKASTLFLEGAELERRGEVSDAVHRYMAAVRLVPDIEFQIFKNRHSRTSNTNSPDARGGSTVPGRVRSRSRSAALNGEDRESDEEDADLEGTLKKRIADRGTMIEADISGTVCPFALLPSELLLTVMKYVIGSELDVRCIEMLSMTSAAFYLLSRDEELWRLICLRVFGEHRLTSYLTESELFGCWRQMFISQPHVYFHGVYIGKCTYIRHGEASFQDKFYRPWHIVAYYRFMKFFADGTVLMVTSSEKPAQIVSQLKSKSTRLSGVIFGRYRLVGQDMIAAQFVRRCEKSEQRSRRIQRIRQAYIPHEVSVQEFNLELRFGDGKRRSAHCVLQWEKYECSFRYLNGQISESSLDVADHQLFPPLLFSRVKSFAQPDGWDEQLM
ncbi:unnamed protein product [Anisakis simplex]|uniref:F-box only protein 9 (inferred by orthology to a human protein) n=1 Tax=Anisakis simplex TaxID=6269 RepID=A0A158PP83_ANISI|nr:unnamed protein product [Anisakis simplex]